MKQANATCRRCRALLSNGTDRLCEDCRELISPFAYGVLEMVAVEPNGMMQIAGHCRAPHLSAARSLVRKGYLRDGRFTGHYVITDKGRAVFEK